VVAWERTRQCGPIFVIQTIAPQYLEQDSEFLRNTWSVNYISVTSRRSSRTRPKATPLALQGNDRRVKASAVVPGQGMPSHLPLGHHIIWSSSQRKVTNSRRCRSSELMVDEATKCRKTVEKQNIKLGVT